jgi:hypothetical protein
MKSISFLLCCVLISISIKGQEVPLVTDRPDQTESSVTVPQKHLQVESGFIFEQVTSHDQNISYNSTLLRYGLLDNFELRLGTDYTKMLTDNSDLQGFNPINAGFKSYIVKENGLVPELAFMLGLSIPNTGLEEYQHKNLVPSFRFAGSYTLTDKMGFGFNIGAEWGQEHTMATYYYSAVLGYSLSRFFGAFAELYGYLPEKADNDMRADAGITCLVLKNLQFDVSGGIGLNEIAPDYFVGTGISLRLPE